MSSRYTLVSLFAWQFSVNENEHLAVKRTAVAEFYDVQNGIYEVWKLDDPQRVLDFVKDVFEDYTGRYPDHALMPWQKHENAFLMPKAARKYVRREMEALKVYDGVELYDGPLHPDKVEEGAKQGPKVTRNPEEQPIKTRNLSARERFAQDRGAYKRRRRTARELEQDAAFHEYTNQEKPKNPFKAPEPEGPDLGLWTTPYLTAPGLSGEAKFWQGRIGKGSKFPFEVVVEFGRVGTPGQARTIGHATTFDEAKAILDSRMNSKLNKGYEAARTS